MRGFTLIELMIVIAIIATLSAIAMPNYQNHLIKVRRLEAMTILVQVSQLLETHYAKNYSYSNFPREALPSQSPRQTDHHYYDITAVLADSTFLLQATPVSSQLSDSCAVLSLNHAGARTASGDEALSCWR